MSEKRYKYFIKDTFSDSVSYRSFCPCGCDREEANLKLYVTFDVELEKDEKDKVILVNFEGKFSDYAYYHANNYYKISKYRFINDIYTNIVNFGCNLWWRIKKAYSALIKGNVVMYDYYYFDNKEHLSEFIEILQSAENDLNNQFDYTKSLEKRIKELEDKLKEKE